MRRPVIISVATLSVLALSTPASAFAHDKVSNPLLHNLLEVVTIAVVTAPLWSVVLWGRSRRGMLALLVAVVQLPVAVIAFVPIANPVLHTAALLTGLAVTAAAIVAVRRAARPAATMASEPTD